MKRSRATLLQLARSNSTSTMASPFKKLSHRNWETVRDYWLDHLPEIDFLSEYPTPTLWQLPEFTSSLSNSQDNEVIGYAAGVREAIFREGIIFAQKLSYCRAVSQIAVAERRQTWAAVISYEACFYAAKAFCYLLGFASVGRGSKLYIDAFFIVNDGTRKRPSSRLELKVHNLNERLTHAVLWSLTERLLNTCQFEGEMAIIQLKLQKFDWSTFSEFRNSIMYDGEFWPLRDEFSKCDLVEPYCYPEFRMAFDEECNQEMPFADQYYSVLRCQRSLLRLMLADIAKFAPRLEPTARAI